MENVEVIELCNNGFVSKELVKNVIHYVCRAALHEAELNRQPDNIVAGLETVRVKLIRFSAAHTHNLGIKAVTYSDSLSEYCFNQHNEIPKYIWYWLYRFYGSFWALLQSIRRGIMKYIIVCKGRILSNTAIKSSPTKRIKHI